MDEELLQWFEDRKYVMSEVNKSFLGSENWKRFSIQVQIQNKDRPFQLLHNDTPRGASAPTTTLS